MPHGEAPRNKVKGRSEPEGIILKANECIAAVQQQTPSGPLFDAFWREGELALLFGPSGVGKSVLAVQLAETIARGRVLDGFRMPATRQKVLYVDMVLSKQRFAERYTYSPDKNRREGVYRFSENFLRGRPARREELAAWLAHVIRKKNIRVVIIDDLAAFGRTCYGTREVLALMRELKQLTEDLGVSVLVLMTTPPPSRRPLVSELDLRRWSAIADVADSVFAMGFHLRSPGHRYLLQTRSRHAPIVWNDVTAPVTSIGPADDMPLAHVFDGRFAARISPEERVLICGIREMLDAGRSFRVVARELGISVSRVRRLAKKWTAEMQKIRNAERGKREQNSGPATTNGHEQTQTEADPDDRLDEWEICGHERPVWLEHERPAATAEHKEPGPIDRGLDVTRIPFAAGLRRRSIYDLEVAINAYDREIYIEAREAITNKPKIWYEINKQGIVMKNVRKHDVIRTECLGRSPYL
jgi:KaiC/GvpD/RAD55 family RecA-like ATPase